MAPSRQFLVQQAVLSAIHANYPNTIKSESVAYAANRLHRLILDGFYEGVDFCGDIRSEYRALARKYGAV